MNFISISQGYVAVKCNRSSACEEISFRDGENRVEGGRKHKAKHKKKRHNNRKKHSINTESRISISIPNNIMPWQRREWVFNNQTTRSAPKQNQFLYFHFRCSTIVPLPSPHFVFVSAIITNEWKINFNWFRQRSWKRWREIRAPVISRWKTIQRSEAFGQQSLLFRFPLDKNDWNGNGKHFYSFHRR